MWHPVCGINAGNYAACQQCICPEDRSLVEARIQAAQTSDAPYEVEHRILWPDGSIRWLAGKDSVYRTPDGKPVRIAGTVMDVTDRKQGDLDRERLLHDLERRTAEMESFVYTISYDLKAPLITISSFACLLEKDMARGDTIITSGVARSMRNLLDTRQVAMDFLDAWARGFCPLGSDLTWANFAVPRHSGIDLNCCG